MLFSEHFCLFNLLFFTQALAFESSCSTQPSLPDGTIVPIQAADHGMQQYPDCAAIGLDTMEPLQCDDGEWIVVDPTTSTHYSLDSLPFSICVDNHSGDSETGYDVDALRNFWDEMQSVHGDIPITCPEEALECINFDVFEDLYERNRFEIQDEQFLGIPLDSFSTLEHNARIHQNVREFEFGSGLYGRVLELTTGETFAVLNVYEYDDFTLNIEPCETDECNWVMYRLDLDEEATFGDSDSDDSSSEDVRRNLKEKRNFHIDDEQIQQRLMDLSENGRRQLQTLHVLSISFLYDPATVSRGYAINMASNIVLTFNNALTGPRMANCPGAPVPTQFVLELNGDSNGDDGVIAVPYGAFNLPHQSGCGSGTNRIHNECNVQVNALPWQQQASLYHCFAPKNAYQGSVVGCASEGANGVTEQHHGISLQIAVHEMGHQFGAKHYDTYCTCRHAQSVWDWDNWCWKNGCSYMDCSAMNENMRSNTGHTVSMRFTNNNMERINAAHQNTMLVAHRPGIQGWWCGRSEASDIPFFGDVPNACYNNKSVTDCVALCEQESTCKGFHYHLGGHCCLKDGYFNQSPKPYTGNAPGSGWSSYVNSRMTSAHGCSVDERMTLN